IAPEVPSVKEKADPSPGLVADAHPLPLVAGNSKHQRCARASRWGDYDPALVGTELGVLKNCEAKDATEKSKAFVIAGDKNGYGCETSEHEWRPWQETALCSDCDRCDLDGIAEAPESGDEALGLGVFARRSK